MQNIMTAAGEKFINITWIKPADYKETYSYIVNGQKSNGTLKSMVTPNTTCTINELVPGSQYDISITTKTSDGTQADPQNVSVCTSTIMATQMSESLFLPSFFTLFYVFVFYLCLHKKKYQKQDYSKVK